MKLVFKAITFIVIISIIATFNFSLLQVAAIDVSTDDNAVFQGNYTNDSIIVVLSNEASLNFKQYSEADFKNIGAKSVVDLSAPLGEKVESTVLAISQSKNYSDNEIYSNNDVDISKYKQIIRIELEETGRDNVLAAIKKLSNMPEIEYVGPNYIYQLPTQENITEYVSTYYIDQWYIDRLQLNQAWSITTGSDSVRVGVIDSGILATHAYLEDNINTNLSRVFTSGSAVIGGVSPSYYHGTGVAGVIAATDCSIGVAQNVDLVSLQVTSSSVSLNTDNVAAAILYAQSIEIDILNMSLNLSNNDNGLYYALSQFEGLVVCSAGNDGEDIDTNPSYPASYRNTLDNIIVVGAINEGKTKYSNSNWGANTVDLFAPGEDITTCGIDSLTITMNMTSIATPFVTGVAALMLSVNPDLTPRELIYMINRSVNIDIANEVRNVCISRGELNAYNAVKYARDHVLSYSDNNDNYTHLVYCSDCYYMQDEPHALYIQAIYGGDNGCNIACRDCSYNFDCDCNPEYGSNDNTGHTVDCPEGNFSFFEEHDWDYEEYSVYAHKATCTLCHYVDYQSHSWSYDGTKYICRICGDDSYIIPGEVMSLSDEELSLLLSSMSEEELDQFIALLPEDAIARVTANLAPVKDDERLTE